MRTAGPAEDRTLLAALAGGNLDALRQLYDAYAKPVYQILLLRTANTEDAEDLLQEAFLSLLQRGKAVTRIRNVRAYLMKVALNLAARSHARRRHIRFDLADAELVDGDAARPDGHVEALRIRDALSQLPREQCEAVVLKVWHGFTFAEIAEIFDVPINTAASRYRYGIERLREMLGDDGGRDRPL